MARGDVIGPAITSVVTAATLDFQPAAGVEGVILEYSGVLGATVTFRWFDGTNASAAITRDNTTVFINRQLRVPITNGKYARYANDTGANQLMTYGGFQTK